MEQDDLNAYDRLKRDADDVDTHTVMKQSLQDNVSHNDIRRLAGELGVMFGPKATKSELCDVLADKGVFFGGVGDETVYIRTSNGVRTVETF